MKVVVVHESDLRDATRILGGTLSQVRAALIVVARDEAFSLSNPNDVGLTDADRNSHAKIAALVRGAEARFVGIRPTAQRLIASELALGDAVALRGGVKANSYPLTDWLRTPPAPPAPAIQKADERGENYRQIAINATLGRTRIVVAEDAFKRTNKIAAVHQGGEGFADFVRSACTGLVSFASDNEHGLDAFFKTVPDTEFASSGPESFHFLHPYTRERIESRLHLKPARELGGMRNAAQKPRLYFHVFKDSDELYVVVLYLGPHPVGTTAAVVAPWR